jgi:hypothetical protein
MRMPRMTTRRWMVAIAFVTVLFWGVLRALALERRSAFHSREKLSCLQQANNAEKRYHWIRENCLARLAIIEIVEDYEAALPPSFANEPHITRNSRRCITGPLAIPGYPSRSKSRSRPMTGSTLPSGSARKPVRIVTWRPLAGRLPNMLRVQGPRSGFTSRVSTPRPQRITTAERHSLATWMNTIVATRIARMRWYIGSRLEEIGPAGQNHWYCENHSVAVGLARQARNRLKRQARA